MNSRMEEAEHQSSVGRDKAATEQHKAVAEFFKELTSLLKLCGPLVRVAVDKALKEMKSK